MTPQRSPLLGGRGGAALLSLSSGRLSLSLSLRRRDDARRARPDKAAAEATSADQVLEMYLGQESVQGTAKKDDEDDEDDEDGYL